MRIFGLTIGSFFTLIYGLSAQPYGNEWITHSQSYYKFPIVQEGVYRIDQAALIAAGIPLASIDPRNIQLFGRGSEIHIYIEGEADGSFDSGDFIEFYGTGNDGFHDASLYPSPAEQAHPAYSLFNDTISYFLTWNNSTSNRRFQSESDISFLSYSPSPFVWKNSLTSRNNQYYEGETYQGGATDPAYAETEGWFDLPLTLGSSRTRTVQTTRAYGAGPNATVHWKTTGQSDYAPLTDDHHLKVQVAGVSLDTIFEGYQVIEKSFQVPVGSLNAIATPFVFSSINDLGSLADRTAVVYMEIRYPHELNFNNSTSFTFLVPDMSGQGKSYLPFTGFNNSGNTWVYDLTNGKRIRVVTTGSAHEVLIPNSGGEKKCHVFSEGNAMSVFSLKAVNGNGLFRDYSTLEAPNTFVIVSHKKLMSGVVQYAAYKNTRGYNSLTVDIDELYDQFAYGIHKHPNSIRSFLDYLTDTWSEDPAFLFLLGKSVKAHLYRQNSSNYNIDLVPSFGNPASDMLFTSGLNLATIQPSIPTGRLSANSGAEVELYLQKMIEYEGAPHAPWMKNALHFAGGTNESESDRFTNYLNQIGTVLSDTSFGANIYTFKKSSSAPYQISLSDSIKNLINSGASFLTFFGHASATGGFDQNIDEPETFNNKGKYPILVGNSCFTGDIHEAETNSTSERFVLIKDKGVIGFIASVDLGFEGSLRNYSNSFFTSLGRDNYGESIGKHMQYAISKLEGSGSSFSNRSVALLMTLHGDPSLVINSAPLPDFAISSSGVFSDPDPITTQVDSFELILDVYNYGKAISDSLMIEVSRVFPNLQSEVYRTTVPAVAYHQKVEIIIPVYPEKGSGYNRFDISLDPSNFMQELDENNNFVSMNYFIKSGDIIPVVPFEFALVPTQGITLKASTGYAFEKYQTYEFQLDTSASFSTPLETTTMSGIGGVYNWTPALLSNMEEGRVYFWRSRNAAGNANSIWRTSSFRYKAGKRGWSQDHFNQFERNNLQFLYADQANRRFRFEPSVRKLTCQTSSTLDLSQLGNILYKIDADLIEYGGCGLGPAIHIAVLDSLSFNAWGTPFQGQNSSNYFGQINFDGNCGKPRVQRFFIFQANNATQLSGLKDMLVNKVPDGNYILAWTWIRNDFSKWDAADPAMRNVFVNLGADSITSISNDSLPYIFFVKKGDKSTALEVIGTKYDEFISLSSYLRNFSSYGSMASTFIGPASAWDSIHWDVHSPDNPATDSATITVGIFKRGENTKEDALVIDKSESGTSISSAIDAGTYPFMELDGFFSDKDFQTAAQIDEWTVLYEGVMDLAIDSRDNFSFYKDTVMEGDNIKLTYNLKNISEYDSDSILVSYYLIDRNRNRRDIKAERLKPLFADSGLVTGVEFNTRGFTGVNTLVVNVNPGMDQLEQHLFNNVGQLSFVVQSDKVKPVLDVTFDGVHILDGDIVSAKPEIAMQLADENPYLILDDTSDFKVYITDVNGNEHQVFFYSQRKLYEMDFIPAKKGSNKAQVLFRPRLIADGVYQLRVSATDRSKNESGEIDYRISFEVINRSTITNLLNYPNPFSTSTRFVFVLTGSRVPDNLQIQIMTVSGKLIKTIDSHELGPVHIGRNISQYAWDGKDEYGDKLANGVYLYRVSTRIDGFDIEHRSTSADRYFKKGFGKMVILR